VASLPGIVLRLHGKDWMLDMFSAVFCKHALPDIAGRFVGFDAVLVDAGSGVLNGVRPFKSTMVVAGDRVSEQVG